MKQHSVNYANPPIPEGYNYACGEWNSGLVIERESDGSQFVWVPAGSFDNDEVKLESESTKKYGGFYISRFNISKRKDGKPQSIQGEFPWTISNYRYAISIAESIEDSKCGIASHLTYDWEYDIVLQWFINSDATSYEEIYMDSSCIGNYVNSKNESDKLAKTGSREDWCINNIYDLAGNVREWTMETDELAVRRGGSFSDSGRVNNASFRYRSSPETGFGTIVGIRAVLSMK